MKSLLPLAGKRVRIGVRCSRWNPGFGSTAEVAHEGCVWSVLLYPAVQILKLGLIKNLPPPALRLETTRNGSMCVLKRTEVSPHCPTQPIIPHSSASHGGLSAGGFWGAQNGFSSHCMKEGKREKWHLDPKTICPRSKALLDRVLGDTSVLPVRCC